MNLLLHAVSKFLNLAMHCPQKCDRSVQLPVKFARRYTGIFKIHYTTGCFIPKMYQSLVFYDNRDLKIFKFKKSEQYFLDKFEIFIRSFDDPLLAILKVTYARRDVIMEGGLNHRFPWRPFIPDYSYLSCHESP